MEIPIILVPKVMYEKIVSKLLTSIKINVKIKVSKLMNVKNDTEVMKLVGISRNSYYKYKRELIED